MSKIIDVLELTWLVIKFGFYATILPYILYELLYNRVYMFYKMKWFYEKQGVKTADWTFPIVGSVFRIAKVLFEHK
jgi:hypothetical protein